MSRACTHRAVSWGQRWGALPLSLRVGAGLCSALVLVALLSWVWTPYPATAIDMAARLQGPSASHWLGTDAYGRDVASQLLVGARSSLAVGLAAVGLGLLVGASLGLLAAARPGWVDVLVQRVADVSLAFPALLTAIVLAAVWGPGMGNAVVAIALFNIPIFARLARATALGIWSRDYVLAARACGKDRWRITWEHVLPNMAAVLIVQASSQFALAILAEAALSYLGLGTQAPQPSWGRMLSEAQTLLYQAPLLAVFPGVAIALSVLGLNLLGDGLRDWIDPRQPPARH
ncbi:MAG: ABC transporter permease [Comamonas sp.]|nr:ABC transporter permease [Comamonas sp.]